MKYNQKQTIKNIDNYINHLENKTSGQQYKPFFTLYIKQRCWFNPLKYIFGAYKFNWFEKGKQPKNYSSAFEFFTDSLDLDTKDSGVKEFKKQVIKQIYEK